MKILLLSYFHQIKGPLIALMAPADFEEELNFIPHLMDLDEKDFFIYNEGEYDSANLGFEVYQKDARGAYEMYMISLVLKDEEIELGRFESVLQEFPKHFKAIRDVNAAFSNKTRDIDLKNRKLKEAEDLFTSFYDELPQETVLFDKNARIMLTGLKNAGKSTLIHNIRRSMFERTFSRYKTAKILFFNNLTITNYDLPVKRFQDKIWDFYVERQDGFAFVIDSSDEKNIKNACNQLEFLIDCISNPQIPILVLLNKVDKNTDDFEYFMEKFQLKAIKKKHKRLKWFLISAKTRTGIFSSFEWLANRIFTDILQNVSWNEE